MIELCYEVNGHTFVWRFDDVDVALRSLPIMVLDPLVDFTWDDAAEVASVMRYLA